ncbi:MAG: hypothetical protein K0R38_1589 [Polyangiaceae bacterium]|jgi:hypothetical protein|nr:hypothetical protein [Polyangiaceae bacterium]
MGVTKMELRAVAQAAANDEDLPNVPWDRVMTHLRYRAMRLRQTAAVTLLLLFATIMGSLGAVASLAQLDAAAEYSASRPLLDALSLASQDVDKKASALRNHLESGSTALAIPQIAASKEEKEKFVAAMEAELRSELATSREIYTKLRQRQTELVTSASSGIVLNIGTILVRVSILGAMLFVAQVLVSIYRYSSRLATYYDGRANALQAVKEAPEGKLDLEAAVRLLGGDGVEYGKVPSNMFESSIELVKVTLDGAQQVAEKARK